MTVRRVYTYFFSSPLRCSFLLLYVSGWRFSFLHKIVLFWGVFAFVLFLFFFFFPFFLSPFSLCFFSVFRLRFSLFNGCWRVYDVPACRIQYDVMAALQYDVASLCRSFASDHRACVYLSRTTSNNPHGLIMWTHICIYIGICVFTSIYMLLNRGDRYTSNGAVWRCANVRIFITQLDWPGFDETIETYLTLKSTGMIQRGNCSLCYG